MYYKFAQGLSKDELSHFILQKRPMALVRFSGFAAEPKKTAVQAETPSEDTSLIWGEEFGGLRARLQAERAVWKAGEVPSFEARIINQGQSDLEFFPAQYAFEVEVDGRWYMSYAPGYDVPNETVSPGSKSKSITIS